MTHISSAVKEAENGANEESPHVIASQEELRIAPILSVRSNQDGQMKCSKCSITNSLNKLYELETKRLKAKLRKIKRDMENDLITPDHYPLLDTIIADIKKHEQENNELLALCLKEKEKFYCAILDQEWAGSEGRLSDGAHAMNDARMLIASIRNENELQWRKLREFTLDGFVDGVAKLNSALRRYQMVNREISQLCGGVCDLSTGAALQTLGDSSREVETNSKFLQLQKHTDSILDRTIQLLILENETLVCRLHGEQLRRKGLQKHIFQLSENLQRSSPASSSHEVNTDGSKYALK